ncbi:tRNA U34 5-methylaminomethyl-2-thiouridine-forming methyltransferase MnmC [Pontibacter ummariensis]|uniref:tRNA U34 5-methylaminomethyl-2-thiouridine-forming methyltransferase MnmC n=1 Tax=Pontibacter ummariensis TaxID=1610492 RepID=A0A239H713_9BACT|nr:tRNA (5-methylaminomethyl-2-thiouridine)(34)-methyltransferase MnmD [Pontibacter ummariensis]PRY10894.1 tRNA U34 5-methylaminomethyl-2-thiouridine-forming methyltransferase MnmC [Pontibacter ummariensis]SNS76064.1 tRNA U34 5-methylaminomethyl-2-thiouridine-forming methyltransferase MnmC [Pontibacter ummariensis]
MHLEIRQTKDGSNTLYVPELNEHYHSVHGALQESQHVFIKHGLEHVLQSKKDIKILEVGFGTGLNAVLTFPFALAQKAFIQYDTLEKFPLSEELVNQLQFEQVILNPELQDVFKQMHQADWNVPVDLIPYFTLQKIHETLEEFVPPQSYYDLVYFDAFAPEKQPELWTEAMFRKLYQATRPGGVLVTYCAKGSFKRSLKAAGFEVEALPGPPGKREMTRGVKPVD